jgi:hypothetical protein
MMGSVPHFRIFSFSGFSADGENAEPTPSRPAPIVALFLVCAGDYKPFAQPTKIKPTNSELSALLQKVEETPGDLCRDTSGNVVSVALRNTNAND